MTSESVLTKKQVVTFGPVSCKQAGIEGYDDRAMIKAEVRFDDECGNGHNTFSITGEIYIPGRRDFETCGCIHDEIAQAFPELAPLIKWHLCSTDGPMHYVSNALFLAGDRDCWGHREGEPCRWERVVKFTRFPLSWRPGRHSDFVNWLETAQGADFEVLRIDHGGTEKDRETFGPKFTLGGAPDKWYQCPFDTEAEGLEFLAAMQRGYQVVKVPTAYSNGKARELDAARSVAIWPEATDEELTAPDLKQRLEARLPQLLADFRKAVESLGFTW